MDGSGGEPVSSGSILITFSSLVLEPFGRSLSSSYAVIVTVNVSSAMPACGYSGLNVRVISSMSIGDTTYGSTFMTD